MRPIDADVYLKKVCTYGETGCGSCKLQTMCPADEPTIEVEPAKHRTPSIPKEWQDKLLERMVYGTVLQH